MQNYVLFAAIAAAYGDPFEYGLEQVRNLNPYDSQEREIALARAIIVRHGFEKSAD